MVELLSDFTANGNFMLFPYTRVVDIRDLFLVKYKITA